MSFRRRLAALAGLIAIVLLALGALYALDLIGSQGGGPGIEKAIILEPPRVGDQLDLEIRPELGKLAPDFELSDIGGRRHRLSDFRGTVVYLNFWATWCTPCIIEMPDIYELQRRHADELACDSSKPRRAA